MSILPLPPIVYGPVYPVTPVLHLTGASLGWDISVTGSISGRLADFVYTTPDHPNTDQWILLNVLPRQDEYIIVEQHSVVAGQTVSSGPSPDKAVQVLPLPSPELPRLIVQSPPHTCSSGISLDGILPGAWINVEIDGGPILLRKQARRGTSDSFPLDGPDPLPEGKSINVWQEIPESQGARLTSPKVKTGPIQSLQLGNPLRKPEYCNQPSTCRNEVCLDKMLPDAHFFVEGPDGPQSFSGTIHSEQWNFEGWFKFPIGSGPPGVITASQQFPRCQLSSDKAVSSPIVTTAKYPPPKLVIPICDNQEKIVLSDLVIGAQLKVNRIVAANTGHPIGVGDTSQTRYAPIPSPTWAFNLPRDWSLMDPAGEVSFTFSQEGVSSCALTSEASDPLTVVASTISPGTSPSAIKLIPQVAWVCSSILEVTGLTVGAEIAILRTDDRTMLDWMPVTDSHMFLTLPLRLVSLPNGVQMFALQRGCRANLKSNLIDVGKFPRDTLPPPELQVKPRPDDTSVMARGLVVGARAYVTVDGNRFSPSGSAWSQEINVVAEAQIIALQEPLKLGTHVNVVQELCGISDSSPKNLPGTAVERFTIILSADPPGPITKGTRAAVKIHCADQDSADKDNAEWGIVTMHGVTGPCGAVHDSVYATNEPGTSVKATLPGGNRVNPAELSIPLLEAPPPTQNILLKFTAGPSTFPTSLHTVTVSNVQWRAIPRWNQGAGASLSGALSGGVFRGTHTFSVPGTEARPVVDVTGSATFTDETGSQTFQLIGSVELGPGACIGWNLAFDWAESGIPGVIQIVWKNGQVGSGPVTPAGFSC